jgi:small subunit ribosomal protein S19e
MPTVYDVPADLIIARLSDYLKSSVPEVRPPEWAAYVKTGVHRERTPHNPDWWYIRSASMLRKLYVRGPLGVSRLRKLYGGRKRRGVMPAHFRRGSGAIARRILQQLEAAGLVAKVDLKGRGISPKGRSLLDSLSTQIVKELEREAQRSRQA